MEVNRRIAKVCARARRELPLLVSGDAAPRVDAWLWQHLRGCSACRREFAGFCASRLALSDLAALRDPDPMFFARLQRQTLAAVAAEPGRHRRTWRPRWLAAMATACLVSTAAIVWSTRGDPMGAVLMRRTPIAVLSGARPLTPASGWIVPASFTPSGQGLRGLQLVSRDPLERGSGSTR